MATEGVSLLGQAGKERGEPKWANVHYPPSIIKRFAITRRRRPNPMGQESGRSRSRVAQDLCEAWHSSDGAEKLAGVAVDAVFDSVSVATTFKGKLAELGIFFGSFSEAVHDHPELVQKYLGSVVPYSDNFFAALNAAVFTDGSFCYIPKGVRCPMELSTYFRINAAETANSSAL
jgi:Fe-S cluster assembly protein SufB